MMVSELGEIEIKEMQKIELEVEVEKILEVQIGWILMEFAMRTSSEFKAEDLNQIKFLQKGLMVLR